MPRPRRQHRPPNKPARSDPQQVALRALRRELRRVHRQLASGQYAQAYPTLKRLADGAARREMPVQAATLYAEAARARVEMAAPGAHNAAWDAVDLGQHVLHLLSGAGRTARAQMLLSQMLQLLERKNYHEQAVELRAHGTALLGAKVKTKPPPQTPLPANCPACSAPLRSDQVEWINARHAALSAECAYCGTVIRPTPSPS